LSVGACTEEGHPAPVGGAQIVFGKHFLHGTAGDAAHVEQHGIGRAKTIYFWDPSGNRNEVFSGSYQWNPDRPALTWEVAEIGKAISYPQRRMADTFLTVVT